MLPLLAALLLAAPPSPAKLKGARFYPAAFAKQAAAGKVDPFEYWTAYPSWVAFLSPGVLELQYGQEAIRCNFTAKGSGKEYALHLKCGVDESDAEWTWVDDTHAVTDLIDVPDGALTRFDKHYDQLVKEHDAEIARKGFAALAGTWMGSNKEQLVIGADGGVTFAGKPVKAELRECLHTQVEPMPRVYCLRWQEGKKELAFGLLEGTVWVEGAMPKELFPDGRPFEGWQTGRIFGRAQR
jgi:hypothetical protein